MIRCESTVDTPQVGRLKQTAAKYNLRTRSRSPTGELWTALSLPITLLSPFSTPQPTAHSGSIDCAECHEIFLCGDRDAAYFERPSSLRTRSTPATMFFNFCFAAQRAVWLKPQSGVNDSRSAGACLRLDFLEKALDKQPCNLHGDSGERNCASKLKPNTCRRPYDTNETSSCSRCPLVQFGAQLFPRFSWCFRKGPSITALW